MDVKKSTKPTSLTPSQEFRQLSVVRLKKDFPSLGLTKGDKGTIVDVYDGPPMSFDVEFDGGKLEDMRPQDLERVHAQGPKLTTPKE